ncbi:MAG TPA: cupin domain-containing protein [Methylibium sp.]|uniref:JmjC domain-containing protein n=1 Tax=Methylibium sp. TaxID=2067992 RepID=UPI002DBC59EC|nr:cupin domain-containing protein [Methylibium sp.]HEU4459387.1 cupin domain-containing protein [Methylibium sp.]
MGNGADLDAPLALLGGASARRFMQRHWQKKPLLVRGAMPGVQPPTTRAALFELAANDDVESRLVMQDERGWRLRRGPFARRALPAARRPGWTLLVQGLDLHEPAAQALLRPFRFVPAARLDDLMLSWASDGGGVGPHLDSYDVFLLQVQGRRRWRWGRARDTRFKPGLPLKILEHFEPTEEALLEPGDLLYLPPGWAHEGVAAGECMTASIGFRAPTRAGLAAELLGRLADAAPAAGDGALYRDPAQAASAEPGRMPPALQAFARDAVERALRRPGAIELVLGEALSEPGARVGFDAAEGRSACGGVELARGTRMLYDDTHVFINGESWRAGGRDAKLLRRLADRFALDAAGVAGASREARALLDDWLAAGWLQERAAGDPA